VTSSPQAALETDRMVLRGGKPLLGEVTLHGAKNSLPKIMVAALLTGEQIGRAHV